MKKVISGGQTGVDQMGLEIAKKYNIETGGVAPKNYMTEDGPNNNLKSFGLIENLTSSYSDRTIRNIKESCGTVIFGNIYSKGSSLTINLCKKLEKPFICNPNIKEFTNWLNKHSVNILNIAGNRGSKLSVDDKTKIYDIIDKTLYNWIQ